MAIVWFTDEDRERMRREKAEELERETLYWEFVEQFQPFGTPDRDVRGTPRIEMLDIRPWSHRRDED